MVDKKNDRVLGNNVPVMSGNITTTGAAADATATETAAAASKMNMQPNFQNSSRNKTSYTPLPCSIAPDWVFY